MQPSCQYAGAERARLQSGVRTRGVTPVTRTPCGHAGANMLGTRRSLLLLRGTTGFASLASYVLACQHLPLADATTFTFLAPLVAAALSPLVLRERPGAAVAAVTPACLLGVLLITQPSFAFRGRGGGAALSRVGVTFGLLHPFASAAAKARPLAANLTLAFVATRPAPLHRGVSCVHQHDLRRPAAPLCKNNAPADVRARPHRHGATGRPRPLPHALHRRLLHRGLPRGPL